MSLLLGTLNSCDEMMTPSLDAGENDGRKIFRVESELVAFTRATDVAFESSDIVGVSVLIPEWDESLYAHNVKFKFTGDGKMESDSPLYWYDDSDQRAFVMSYYPYSSEYDIYDEWIFTVNADQSDHYRYSASDLMFACEEAKPTSEAVKLHYRHMLSKVVVYIDNKLDEEISNVFIKDVYGSVKVDVGTDGPAEYAVQGSEGIIKMGAATDSSGKALWAAIVVPQENVSPELVITTASERQYTFTLSAPATFTAGTRNTATLTLEESALSTEFTPEISDWLPGNDLNFGQDTGGRPSVKGLCYTTGYMDDVTEKGAPIFWNDGKVTMLPNPIGDFGVACGAVLDKDGNLCVGGFCDSPVGEWSPVMWVNGEGKVLYEASDALIVDVDVTSSGEVITLFYGFDKEFYTRDGVEVYLPENFRGRCICVDDNDDIYICGYVENQSMEWQAAYVKNSELFILDSGSESVEQIAVYDGKVYVAGSRKVTEVADWDVNNDSRVDDADVLEFSRAVLWIDGVMQDLVPSNYHGWTSAEALFVDYTGVYAGINTQDGDIWLWKDGTVSNVTTDGTLYDDYIYDMYVVDGTVCFGGFKYEGDGGNDRSLIGPSIWYMNAGTSSAVQLNLHPGGTGERGRFSYL